MDFIFASDLSEYPVSSERVEYARYQRDEYAKSILGLPDTFKYTRSVYELFDYYTYKQWANLDKEFCHKAVEKYCSQMMNKENHLFMLVANGNILYSRNTMPTEDEMYAIYVAFLKWNGSSADPSIGGFPFAMYMMYYMPIEAPPPSPVLRRSERLANKPRINYMD
jgi:hypothetical protein